MRTIIVDGATPRKKLEREKAEQKPALTNNKAKSIFKRIADIVVEDIRYALGRKETRAAIEKAREDKMRYDAFMEMFKK